MSCRLVSWRVVLITWLCAGVRVAQAHTPSSASSFAVRGDGVTTLVATDATTTAMSVSVTAVAFTKAVMAVSTTKAAATDFYLLKVRAVAARCQGVARMAQLR